MNRRRARHLVRTLVVTLSVAALALGSTIVASAAKPANTPATTLKLSTVLSAGNATFNYQVNVPPGAIAAQDCVLRYPNGLVGFFFCDNTANSGSGKKLAKFSISQPTPQLGDYGVEISITLLDGRHLFASNAFTVIGPAVRFEVTGLVAQPAVCYIGIDCVDWPPADYPRQIAMIRALDAAGHVATGYTGTVSFRHPLTNGTPDGLQNMTLTNGVGYVPVLVPSLSLGFYDEPFTSNCPSPITGNGVTLTVTDTVDPSIFGCQNIPGGSLGIVFPAGFFDEVIDECPTGCLSEPTGNITINTNLFIPAPLQTTIDTDGSLIITGQTVANLYFTQPLQIGVISIEGQGIPVGTLDPCQLCTSDMTYYAGAVGSLSPTTAINLDNSTITVQGCVSYIWDTTDPCLNPNFVPVTVTTTITHASDPTCYSDPTYITVVNLAECD